MSLGTKQNLDSMFLAQTTSTAYEALEDKPKGDHSVVHEEFIEHLSCSAESLFWTGLSWKGDCPPLPVNKSASLKLAVYCRQTTKHLSLRTCRGKSKTGEARSNYSPPRDGLCSYGCKPWVKVHVTPKINLGYDLSAILLLTWSYNFNGFFFFIKVSVVVFGWTS